MTKTLNTDADYQLTRERRKCSGNFSSIVYVILFSDNFSHSGWLGSRVVSVLDSDAVGPGFKSQSRRCLGQTVHTHCACVHQAAKLVAALLRPNCRPGGK